MKVRYVGIETTVLTYGNEYVVVEEIKAADHLMGYRITGDLGGTTFVRSYEVQILPGKKEGLKHDTEEQHQDHPAIR